MSVLIPAAPVHPALAALVGRLAVQLTGSANQTTALIFALAPEFPDQLMLGMDTARSSYWKSYGGAQGDIFMRLSPSTSTE
jgi:hypothetical protein